jgi:polysaccharide export outer membrane protein
MIAWMLFLVRLLCAVLLSVSPRLLSAQTTDGSGGEAYRLRPGDALRIELRDEPSLGGNFTVDGEGQALLPLIGLVRVAGRPFGDVRRDVLTAYGRELVDAPGRVRVTPVLRISVLGEVVNPGLVPVDPTFSLADVVASAGGLTPSADRKEISLMRDGLAVLTTSLDEIAQVRTPILSGDHVVVGRRSWLYENLSILVGGAVSVAAAVATALILR